MKVSLKWLQEKFLNAKHVFTLERLNQQLPMAGFEIDGIESSDDDYVLDIAITANRGDCLSVRGMDREIACLNQLLFHDWILEVKSEAWQKPTQSFVQIDAKEACPYYAGAFLHNISPDVKTPNFICDRLHQAGIDRIHPVVDISNYVMLEVGQPLHAFDAKRITPLQVRFAKPAESLQTLTGEKINLSENTLVIADESGVQAMAGIIGGLHSGVDQNTSDIFLESAHFTPEAIIGCPRQYGLQTEAAQRFERGVDPHLPLLALNYAAHLMIKHLGATAGGLHLAHGLPMLVAPVIKLRLARIKRILGIDVAADLVEEILTALGMKLENNAEGWLVTPPSFRFDVALEVDLIEEVGRVNGYDKIPTHYPRIEQLAKAPAVNPALTPAAILVNRGYQEIISYSFISEALQQQCFPETPMVRLQNPLSSELAVMRTSLWPSLVMTLQYNLNRKQTRGRYFEIGRAYQTDWDEKIGSVKQDLVISGLVSGNLYPEQWGVKPVAADFFDVKADVVAMVEALGLARLLRFLPTESPMLQAGQAAEIFLADKSIGMMGRLHPKLQQQFELPAAVYLFELNLDDLQTKSLAQYQEISRFPAVRRDFAFLVNHDQAVFEILHFVEVQLAPLCQKVILFDVYQGKNIAADQKSIAFGVVLQDIHTTLADEQVNKLCNELVAKLTEKFNIKMRA